MKIKFLGTSSGWPLPRLGCNCKICLSNDPKDRRLRPSILVNEEILIDAPYDIYHQIKKFDVDTEKLKVIVLTHAHDDHIAGLYDLSHIYGKSQKISLASSPSVISQVREKIPVSLFSFNKIFVKPFKNIEILPQTFLWLIPVEHTVECYGIKIKARKPILYAPEFRKIKKNSKEFLGDLDLAVIDGSSKTHIGQAHGHESMVEGLRLGNDIRAKKLYFTNIGHKTDKHKNLVKFVKESNSRYGIAYDGLEITL